MKRSYFCPHCGGLLNPGSQVVFVLDHGAIREMVLLSPEPGNYSLLHRNSFTLEPGTLYTLRCPLCHADLVAVNDERMIEIHAVDAGGTQIRVNFSRVYGEHATYLLTPTGVERYGKDAGEYEPVNFFGEGELVR